MFQAWFSSFVSVPHRTPCGETEQRYRIPARYATRPHRRVCRTPAATHVLRPCSASAEKRIPPPRPRAASTAPPSPHTSLRPLLRLYRKTDTTTAPARRDASPRTNETTPRPSSVANSRPLRSTPRSSPPHQPSPPDRPCLPTPIPPDGAHLPHPLQLLNHSRSIPAAVPTNAPYSAPSRHPAQKKFPLRRQGRNGNRIARGKCALADYSHSIILGFNILLSYQRFH